MKKFKFLGGSVIFAFMFLMLFSNNKIAATVQNNQVDTLKNFNQTEYLISYTDMFKPGGYLATYDKNGKLLDQSKIKAQQILSNTKNDNMYYFSSTRNDKHYEINKKGEVKLVTKPAKLKNIAAGAYFIHSEHGYVYYDANVGATKNYGYVSHLIFWKEGAKTKQSVQLQGTIQAAHILNQKLYAYSQTEEKIYIYVIDLTTNKKMKVAEIPNKGVLFTSTTHKSMFQVVNGKFVLALSDNVNQKLPSRLVVIDPNSLKVEKEVTFSNPRFIPIHMHVLNNQLYAIGDMGEILTFDKNFALVKQFKLQETKEFLKELQQKEGVISDVQIEGNKAYVFYQYSLEAYKNGQERGAIHEYFLEDGKKVNGVKIKFDKNLDDITFLVINHKK